MQYQFEYPYVFLFLFVLLGFSKFFALKEKMLIIPHLDLLNHSYSKFTSDFFLKWIFFIFLLIAMSSPYRSDEIITQENKGYNIGLILDSSHSMREKGFNRNNIMENKFDVVKTIVSKFIQKRKNDNLSIVVFGNFSFVALPLTFDKSMTISVLNTLRIGMAGRNTAINDGLAQSIKTLSSTKAKKNIAILLTDGRNTAGEIPLEVAVKLAKKHNVKIYTIGMGRKGEYDRAYLEYISNETGGVFFSSSNEKALGNIYKEINKLEKQKIKSNIYEKKTYYFYYPLSISIMALFLYILVQSRKQI